MLKSSKLKSLIAAASIVTTAGSSSAQVHQSPTAIVNANNFCRQIRADQQQFSKFQDHKLDQQGLIQMGLTMMTDPSLTHGSKLDIAADVRDGRTQLQALVRKEASLRKKLSTPAAKRCL